MDGTDFYKHKLDSKTSIQKFIKQNYPKGPIGELLFRADANRFNIPNVIKLLDGPADNTKYELVVVGDAKAKYNKFGLTSVTGEPFYCGHFIEPSYSNYAEKQNNCEARALVYAIRLCRDFCYYKKINFSDFTLHYLTDSQVIDSVVSVNPSALISLEIRNIRREVPINLRLSWIRGLDNSADIYTLKDADIVHPNYQTIDKFLTVSRTPLVKKPTATFKKKEKN